MYFYSGECCVCHSTRWHCLLVISLKCWGFWICDTCFSKPSILPWSFMTRGSLLFSQFSLSPPVLFSSSLLLSFSQGHCFLSVASPEQISALKCLLRLFSLTLLIILHSHDNSPLVSHLEFISFSPPHPSQLQKKIFRGKNNFLIWKILKMLLMRQPTDT